MNFRGLFNIHCTHIVKTQSVFFNLTAYLCMVACVLQALVATEKAGPNLPLVIMFKIRINDLILKPDIISLHHCCGRQIRGPLLVFDCCDWLMVYV